MLLFICYLRYFFLSMYCRHNNKIAVEERNTFFKIALLLFQFVQAFSRDVFVLCSIRARDRTADQRIRNFYLRIETETFQTATMRSDNSVSTSPRREQ